MTDETFPPPVCSQCGSDVRTCGHDPNELVGIRVAAEITGLAVETIRKYHAADNGKFPAAVRKIGTAFVWRRGDLTAYAEGRP